jgi:hypothetical protein
LNRLITITVTSDAGSNRTQISVYNNTNRLVASFTNPTSGTSVLTFRNTDVLSYTMRTVEIGIPPVGGYRFTITEQP